MSEQISSQPVSTSSLPVDLYSPTVIAVVTFFLSFPAGLVLAAINWNRMDMRSKAVNQLLAGSAIAVVLALALLLTPASLGRVIGLAVNLGAVWYLRKQMTEDIDEIRRTHQVNNANGLVGVLIGLGVLVVYVVVILALAFILALLGAH